VSVNKVILIGNLGADPDIRYMPNGGAVANINVATSFNWKDKQSGERRESTEWHRVVFFNRLAEIVGEYLRKGSQVYIEGRLQTRKWQDKNGQDRWTTEIVASEMNMLGSRSGGTANFDNNQSEYPQENQKSAPASTSQSQDNQVVSRGSQNQQSSQVVSSSGSAGYEDFDDDIPF